MTNYNVKKAKLIDRYSMEIEYDEEETTVNELAKKCRREVHPDLIAAFDNLTAHLPLICELVDPVIFKPNDELIHIMLGSYMVTGFSIGGENEHEGVVLIGRKTLGNKKVINLVSPFTKWEDEHSPYKYSSELSAAISRAENEVIAYLQGKFAPKKQLELELAS